MKNLALVKEIAGKVPAHCRVSRCRGDGCEVRLEGMPSCPDRLTIKLDCEELGIRDQKRCDYLFIGQTDTTTYVALIELKSGKVDSATGVAKQLQGGANLVAAKLLPPTLPSNSARSWRTEKGCANTCSSSFAGQRCNCTKRQRRFGSSGVAQS